MTPPNPHPLAPLHLAAHRPAVAARLTQFYSPNAPQMGIDDTLEQVLCLPQKLQDEYEGLAEPTRPDGLFRGRYIPLSHGGWWYPEPIDYLRIQSMQAKLDGIFRREPEARQVVTFVCRRLGRNLEWIMGNQDDVIRDTVLRLLASHRLPAESRSVTNDYERFLAAWKDTYSLSETEMQLEQRKLFHPPIYNTVRRKLRQELRMQTNAEPGFLEQLAVVNEWADAQYDGRFEDVLDGAPSLSARERLVLRLTFVEGVTLGDIAGRIGRSTTTVHTVLHRGLAKLAAGRGE